MRFITPNQWKIHCFPVLLRFPAKLIRGVWRLSILLCSTLSGVFRLVMISILSKWQRQPVVLIGLVEHFGDIVACEPIIPFIKERVNGADIVWVTSYRYCQLLSVHPELHRVIGVSCLTEWMLLKCLFFNEHSVDLHIDKRACAWFPFKLNKPNSSGVTLENYYCYGHLLRAFCLAANLPPLDASPRFFYAEPRLEVKAILPVGNRYVVFHCRSNEDDRNWPGEKFRDLAAYILGNTPFHIVEIGVTPALYIDSDRVHDCCGRFELREYAYLIESAKLFVGVDSGFGHMANALNTPGVILLGHYRAFKKYMPYSGFYAEKGNCKIIQHDGPISALPLRRVCDAVMVALSEQKPGSRIEDA